MKWKKGDHILLRNRRLGRTGYVFPVTVVEDDENFSALYLAAGTRIKQRVMPDGSPFSHDIPYAQKHAAPHRTGDGKWKENSVLMLTKPGEAHSFWAFWRDVDWKFLGWYVNLQAPLERTALGFDTGDHVLDITVDADGSWERKDEDEFAEARRMGRFAEGEAEEILAEAARAESKIKSRSWPLGSGWEAWMPEKGWTLPEIPEGWDRM
jgi:hypothetical protein